MSVVLEPTHNAVSVTAGRFRARRNAQESALMEQLLSTHPSLLARYKDFYAAVWEQDQVPGRVPELCRLRTAAVQGCHPWQPVRPSRSSAPRRLRDRGSPLTDVIIGMPQAIDESLQAQLKQHFNEAEIQELALGIGIFLSMSKVLINLGLEPESMPITLLPTPSAPPRP